MQHRASTTKNDYIPWVTYRVTTSTVITYKMTVYAIPNPEGFEVNTKLMITKDLAQNNTRQLINR